MALGINGVIGLSLILVDLSMKITLHISGIKSYPEFGLFYVGIINLIFSIIKNYFDSFTRTIISMLLIISLIYPLASILESFFSFSFLSKLEIGGLWSLSIAIMVMILSKLKI